MRVPQHQTALNPEHTESEASASNATAGQAQRSVLLNMNVPVNFSEPILTGLLINGRKRSVERFEFVVQNLLQEKRP